MKRSYFVPDEFIATIELVEWAKKTFAISSEEVGRQTEMWRDHEYKRAYSDWTRCWRRWFRQAEKYDTLKRELKPREFEQVTPEQRTADILAFEKDMRKYGR